MSVKVLNEAKKGNEVCQKMTSLTKGGPPELLKRMSTRTHERAKFSRICAKFKLLNTELAKQALFHIFGTI